MGLASMASRAATGVGRATRKVTYGPAGTAGALIGVAQIAAAHPLLTSAAVLGIGSVAMYSSATTQAIGAGPTSVQKRPGSSGGDFDLGASGALVFALHRNR